MTTTNRDAAAWNAIIAFHDAMVAADEALTQMVALYPDEAHSLNEMRGRIAEMNHRFVHG